ncbi:MAG: hypothetical protein M1839_002247 [Geoglossum umbratile]|nr:MAG: hypothetical protein M1839_002247 [Geoglossum umbratile]
MGAHRTGRVSLDYRLRESRDMNEGVCELLDGLNHTLQQADLILSGKQQPYDELSFDSDSSDSAPEGGIDAVKTPRPTELQQTFRDVQKIITYLYELALYLRSPAPSSRLSKLAKIDVSHFEEWDRRHVEEKFRAANPTLLRRLGKANSRRRQMFKYYERHHSMLSRNLATFTTPEPKAGNDKAVAGPTDAIRSNPPTLVPSVRTTPSTDAVTTNTQTTIATFVDTGEEIFTEDNLSETSSAASEGPDEESTLHMPPLPKGAIYGEAFQCPYCYEMMKVSSSQSWRYDTTPRTDRGLVANLRSKTVTLPRIHVLRDLQPYICTFGNCILPGHMFGTRHEWFDHEARIHRAEWLCNECSAKISTRAGFENHMRLEHRESFADSQLPALVELCVRPMDKRATGTCPLCLKDGQLLRSHLARHLRTLALFVLPRASDEDGSAFKSDGAQVWGSEDDASSSSESQSDQMSEVSTEALKKAPDLDPEALGSATENLHHLCLAAGLGNLEEVRALLQIDGINPNSKDGSGRIPLSAAAQNGRESVVRALLEHKGIDPNLRGEGGRTPLMFAIEGGYEGVVRTLLGHEATDPNRMDFSFRTPLVIAIDNGNKALVRALLEDERTDPNLTNRTLQSPLSYATESGNEAMVRVLLEYEAVNPNLMNSEHQTPLMSSAESGNESMVRAILENDRVNPNLMNRAFETPIVVAAGNGSEGVVRALLENEKVDPNLRGTKDRTALILAVENKHEGVVRALLEHKRVNANSTLNGQTALMFAAEQGNEAAVAALLGNNAVDVNATNHLQGSTALSYAARNGHTGVVQLLLSVKNIKIHTEDNEGHTAMWWASQGKHKEVERLLTEF